MPIAEVLERIERLWGEKPKIASEHIALQRQITAVETAFPLIQELVEPFLSSSRSTGAVQIGLHLHLYARILDDAVDEGLPVHKYQLLQAQPLLWETISLISQWFPEKAEEVSVLIRETVQAALNEWNRYGVEWWGTKNHHLLITPLLLSRRNRDFQRIKPCLSDFLFLLQAKEEILERGMNIDFREKRELLLVVESLFNGDHMEVLCQGGWKIIACRLPDEIMYILSHLKK